MINFYRYYCLSYHSILCFLQATDADLGVFGDIKYELYGSGISKYVIPYDVVDKNDYNDDDHNHGVNDDADDDHDNGDDDNDDHGDDIGGADFEDDEEMNDIDGDVDDDDDNFISHFLLSPQAENPFFQFTECFYSPL